MAPVAGPAAAHERWFQIPRRHTPPRRQVANDAFVSPNSLCFVGDLACNEPLANTVHFNGALQRCLPWPEPFFNWSESGCSTLNGSVLCTLKACNRRRERNVRFGSKADISQCNHDVRFTPESGDG